MVAYLYSTRETKNPRAPDPPSIVRRGRVTGHHPDPYNYATDINGHDIIPMANSDGGSLYRNHEIGKALVVEPDEAGRGGQLMSAKDYTNDQIALAYRLANGDPFEVYAQLASMGQQKQAAVAQPQPEAHTPSPPQPAPPAPSVLTPAGLQQLVSPNMAHQYVPPASQAAQSQPQPQAYAPPPQQYAPPQQPVQTIPQLQVVHTPPQAAVEFPPQQPQPSYLQAQPPVQFNPMPIAIPDPQVQGQFTQISQALAQLTEVVSGLVTKSQQPPSPVWPFPPGIVPATASQPMPQIPQPMAPAPAQSIPSVQDLERASGVVQPAAMPAPAAPGGPPPGSYLPAIPPELMAPSAPTKDAIWRLGPQYGAVACRYHYVSCNGVSLTLFSDTRYDWGMKFVPPVLDEPISIEIPHLRKRFHVSYREQGDRFGAFEFYVLVVHSAEDVA